VLAEWWRLLRVASRDFEHGLAEQESIAVTAPRVKSEVCRSRNYVGVVIVATVAAAGVATLRNMPIVSHQGH
jgi:hypothetical protein